MRRAGAASESLLLESARDLARVEGARALEVRQGVRPGDPAIGARADRVDLVLPLASSEEAQWEALPAKVRNQTRKSLREGLRLASAGPDVLLRGFYDVFRSNMRDLGSPVHTKRLFEAMARHFGARLRFIVATLDERPVGLLARALQLLDPPRELRLPRARRPHQQDRRVGRERIVPRGLRRGFPLRRGARSR